MFVPKGDVDCTFAGYLLVYKVVGWFFKNMVCILLHIVPFFVGLSRRPFCFLVCFLSLKS